MGTLLLPDALETVPTLDRRYQMDGTKHQLFN